MEKPVKAFKTACEGDTEENYDRVLMDEFVEQEFAEDVSQPKPAGTPSLIGEPSAMQPEVIRYKKTGGAADGAGESFECKMLTLVFLRMLATGHEFLLASNMEEAGTFDDIVLRYRKHPNDPWRVAYLQLKHKKDMNKNIPRQELLDISGPFSLHKYCASYKAILSLSDQQLESLDENQFILFTNPSINETLVNTVESDELFDTGGKVVTFKPEEEVYQQLCDWVDFKEMLSKLNGQVDGLNAEEVRTRITDALEVCQNSVGSSLKKTLLQYPTSAKLKEVLKKLEPVSDKATYSTFLAKLQVYTKQAQESELDAMIMEELVKVWFRSDVPMFQALQDGMKSWWQKEDFYLTRDSHLWLDLVKSQTEAFSKSTITRLTNSGMVFVESSLQTLHNKINEVAASGGIFNLRVDSKTAASSLKVHQALAKFKNVLHVDVKALLDHEGDVLSAWETKWCPVLVVECDAEIEQVHVARFCKRILKVVGNQEVNKLLVLIAPEKHELNVQLYDNAKIYKSFNDNCEWNDLTEETKTRILSTKVVMNGTQSEFTLSELVGVDKSFICKAETKMISQLVGGNFTCGKVLDEVCKFFVSRRLQESPDGVPFAVNSVKDVGERRVVLIVAEPGMGKSTLITHLTKSAKTKDPTAWIVHIKLNDCAQYLKEIDENHFDDVVAKKLLEQCSLSPENGLEKLLLGPLRYKLVVFLDGVDEVCPYYEKQVFNFLNFLSNLNICQLWVTSRPVFLTKLEDKLKVKAFHLLAFSEKDRKEFFNKVWMENFPTDKHEECKEATISLLTWLTNSLGEDNPILGVPLMTAMIAEMFQDRITSGNGTLVEFMKTERLDVMNLYKTFVDKMFDLYCVEKKKTPRREVAANIDDEEAKRKKMHHSHRLAALKVLFSREEIADFEFKGKEKFDEHLAAYLKEVSNGREKIGIIDNVINGTAHFVHRSFAEYFVATWLLANLDLNRKIVEQVIFSPTYKLVSEMLNRSLAENHLIHVAVLNRDLEAMERILAIQQTPSDVNELDAGGRTPLHLAVLLSSSDPHLDYISIVKCLVQGHNARLDVADKVLAWSPLRYAERSRAWSALHIMVEHGGNDTGNQNIWPTTDPCLMIDAARDETASELVLRYLMESKRGPMGKTMIHWAAEEGNVDVLESIFSRNLPLDIKDHEGNSALRYASSLQAMRYLLDRGLNLEAVNNQGLTALQDAAQNGAYENMAVLLEVNAWFIVNPSVKTSQVQLNACLLCAAFVGILESVQALITMGASDEYQDNNGHTAAWVAMHREHTEVMDWLLLRGCHERDTPLHGACRKGDSDIVPWLLSRGEDVEARGRYGQSPLHAAIRSNKLAVVQLLLEKGASTESRDSEGRTPLYTASSKSNNQIVSLLLRNGADVNAEDNHGLTSLHDAIANNKVAMAQLLLAKGARTDCHDEELWTPLHHASSEGNDHAVSLLLRHGAEVNGAVKDNRTPLHCAILSNKLVTVKQLLEKRASTKLRDKEGWTPLHQALALGHDQAAFLLLRHGADVNAADKKGRTSLHCAIGSNKLDMLQLLLEKGASIGCRDNDGWTPLHHSSSVGHDQGTSLLLRHGADINAADNQERTPLYLATQSNMVNMVRLLLEKGAATECRDKDGSTPLNRAAWWGNEQAASLLIRHGADVNATNSWGYGPIDLARKYPGIMQMLQEAGGKRIPMLALFSTVKEYMNK